LFSLWLLGSACAFIKLTVLVLSDSSDAAPLVVRVIHPITGAPYLVSVRRPQEQSALLVDLHSFSKGGQTAIR
jgi:hypothetical protein